jgi:hypothetical protein
MHKTLHDPGSRDEAVDVIRSLIDEIRPMSLDGELRIEMGELADILEAVRGGRRPKARRSFDGRTGGANQGGCGARNHLDLLPSAAAFLPRRPLRQALETTSA